MSERIDHAALARDNMHIVATKDLLPEVALVTITAAQVHATLALVEQKRISNVISAGEQFDFIGEPDEWQRERVLRADVREGLGI